MGVLYTTLAEITDKLVADGVRAVNDPAKVNPPCVLVAPPSFAVDVACGGTATFTCYCIGPRNGGTEAWRVLDDLAEKVAGVVDVESITPTGYGNDDTVALPALAVTWTQTLTWPA